MLKKGTERVKELILIGHYVFILLKNPQSPRILMIVNPKYVPVTKSIAVKEKKKVTVWKDS